MDRRIINNSLQRNMREKARRTRMRNLLLKLAAVLRCPSKLSMPNLIDEAASHINKMKLRIDELEKRKNQVLGLPILQISSSDCTVEVNLISGFNKNFMLHEVIQLLQQQGAEVASFSSFHRPDNRIIYTIKSQAMYPRIGIETSKIIERLQELVCSN